MTIELKLQQVTIEPGGLYAVYAQAIETETGKVIAKKCVEGSNKEEIKDALRPAWVKIKADYETYQIIKAAAEAALAELEAEP